MSTLSLSLLFSWNLHFTVVYGSFWFNIFIFYRYIYFECWIKKFIWSTFIYFRIYMIFEVFLFTFIYRRIYFLIGIISCFFPHAFYEHTLIHHCHFLWLINLTVNQYLKQYDKLYFMHIIISTYLLRNLQCFLFLAWLCHVWIISCWKKCPRNA